MCTRTIHTGNAYPDMPPAGRLERYGSRRNRTGSHRRMDGLYKNPCTRLDRIISAFNINIQHIHGLWACNTNKQDTL